MSHKRHFATKGVFRRRMSENSGPQSVALAGLRDRRRRSGKGGGWAQGSQPTSFPGTSPFLARGKPGVDPYGPAPATPKQAPGKLARRRPESLRKRAPAGAARPERSEGLRTGRSEAGGEVTRALLLARACRKDRTERGTSAEVRRRGPCVDLCPSVRRAWVDAVFGAERSTILRAKTCFSGSAWGGSSGRNCCSEII